MQEKGTISLVGTESTVDRSGDSYRKRLPFKNIKLEPKEKYGKKNKVNKMNRFRKITYASLKGLIL